MEEDTVVDEEVVAAMTLGMTGLGEAAIDQQMDQRSFNRPLKLLSSRVPQKPSGFVRSREAGEEIKESAFLLLLSVPAQSTLQQIMILVIRVRAISLRLWLEDLLEIACSTDRERILMMTDDQSDQADPDPDPDHDLAAQVVVVLSRLLQLQVLVHLLERNSWIAPAPAPDLVVAVVPDDAEIAQTHMIVEARLHDGAIAKTDIVEVRVFRIMPGKALQHLVLGQLLRMKETET